MSDNIDWNEKIEEYRNSGIGLDKWCIQHNISKSAMSYHLYGKKNRIKCTDEASDQAPRLVPLVIKEETVTPASKIVIQINGASIEVDSNTDFSLLKRIVEVLQ